MQHRPLRYLLILALLASPAAAASECVIVLHGLWRSALSMKAVEWALEGEGYQVANLTYPSTTHPIEELAVMAVEEGLASCRQHRPRKISFVTHSLGGILVRQYLAGHTIRELHRVVMLGPPNQGAQLADYAVSLGFTRPLRPEAVDQLGTGERSVPLALGPVDFELGVIAGNNGRPSFTPGAPQAASDGTVAVAETRVEGMRDFIELPVSHTFMMWGHDVLEQTLYFLRNGRFQRAAAES